MEKNLKIFQMKSKTYYDFLTIINSCLQKFYSMWVLKVELEICKVKDRCKPLMIVLPLPLKVAVAVAFFSTAVVGTLPGLRMLLPLLGAGVAMVPLQR